ncbi:MAG: preprotein translocase subunit SecE [Verrucomicrobium sp.]|nr:preprotein translocase subunit SecE [Verrucomicrobium sp.]
MFRDLLSPLSGLTFFQWGLLAIGLGLALWILVRHGAGIVRFAGETKAELQKCSWPWNPQEQGPRKYKELIDATMIVAISALFLAAFVTSWDFLLVHVIGLFTHSHA